MAFYLKILTEIKERILSYVNMYFNQFYPILAFCANINDLNEKHVLKPIAN